MALNIVNLLSRAFSSEKSTQLTTTSAVRSVSSNPFANPFMSNVQPVNLSAYAKNKPINGGYFAGYYNGKPNIVGQRLFIEV
ncbi:MAG: hypothetical protein MJ229_02710 [bacterium]|nr:hypothetical protein [bacterium]